MNKLSERFSRVTIHVLKLSLLIACLALLVTGAFAQETGGELGGGAGIFRPKNPE